MKKPLTPRETGLLLKILEKRFNKYMIRHELLNWDNILKKLNKYPEKLWTLRQMEITGGEPDVVDYDQETDTYFFYDCSFESPRERRNFCYDQNAFESIVYRKPQNSAIEVAQKMGIELLSKQEYKYLQQLGDFDTKTSSWLRTPKDIRDLGGAIFADFRYNRVFIYHNGVKSYFTSRGFRGVLKV